MNRYVNLDGTERRKLAIMIKGLKKTFQVKIKNKGVPAPCVKPEMSHLRKPVKTGQGARITWLGHSGWLIQLSGMSILIDPVMGKRINAFIKRKAMFNARLHDLRPFTAVLITHDHYDHLQVKLLKRVKAKVIAGTGTGKLLQSKKINAQELKWWESVKIGNVKITFVPSQHGSQRGVLDSNTRLWGGYVIESPDICLYHAGDTAYFKIFKEIAASFKKIDIALLPIGGYSTAGMGKNHLTPELAIKAFIDLEAKLMVPIHWGTYQTSHEQLDEPPLRLIKEWQKKKLDNKKLKIMAVGESFEYKK